jgi:hypothetical protein
MTSTMTDAMYQLTDGDTILRLADNACIPPDPANTDYAAYLEWVEAGNTPEPAPEPVAPVELTPAEKLAASGLTVEELKSLLGLD